MAKANIRKPAITWFEGKYPSVVEPVIASKFYSASESWNNSRVWFFQIPRSIIEPNKIKYIHLVSQNHLNGEPYLYFKIPTLFLLRNEKSFEVDHKAKVVRLYLSAEAVDMYREVRKGSNLDFGVFLQADENV
jgi:hypothetical protein